MSTLDIKQLGGGKLHTLRAHVCDRPSADAARAAGGENGSTWTCDVCRKRSTLRAFTDKNGQIEALLGWRWFSE